MKLTSLPHASSVFRPRFTPSTVAVSSLAFLSAVSGVYSVTCSSAAPAKPRTLAFSVSAKLTSQSGEDGQTINAKVWTKGNKARIETAFGGRPMVLLISPAYIYKLIPSAKAGVRWKNTQAGKPGGGLDLQSLLRNPAQIRSMLKSKGAKFEGASKMGSTPVDVFVVPLAAAHGAGSKSRAYSAKGWLRQSDSLPLRLDIVNSALSAQITWHDYKRDIALADTLFAAPAGYKIRDSEGGPSLMGF